MARGVRGIDIQLYMEAFSKYAMNEYSVEQAAKHCGVSAKTFGKYTNLIFEDKPLPAGVFRSHKVLLDYSQSGKLNVKIDKQILPYVVSIDRITDFDMMGMRKITLTLAAEDIQIKGEDGRTVTASVFNTES